MSRYLWQASLHSGDGRRAYRSEIPDEAIAAVRPLLARDGLHERAFPEIPLDLIVTRRATLYCTVRAGEDRVATFGVAPKSLGADALWREMHEADGAEIATDPEKPPAAPWLGLLVEPAMRRHPKTTMLATIALAKALAWAWIERPGGE